MANNFDDFNYDSDDPELDDNGLPIEEKMSPDDWMDVIRSLQDPDDEYSEDDEQDDDDSGDDYGQRRKKDADTDTSSKTKDGDGGRFGNNSQPQNQLSSKLSKPSTPGQGGGGSDWFSKLSGGGKASGQVAGKAAGKVAASSTASAGAAGSAASGALAAAAPYIGIALLIILAIILVIVIIVAIVSFFQGKSDPANMSTNTYVTSEYFYGTRSVYIDENELINSLQLSYKQYVLDVVDNFEENNPSIDITITLPELAEGEILSNETEINQHITNLSLGIGNIVATGSNVYSGVEFSTLYPQIEYFGLTSQQGELTLDFIRNYIVDNNLYTAEEGTNIDDLIETTITTDVDLQYIYNRAEKVMIKDEIATENGLTDIKQRQYIASIYMPNKDIIIESASYTIASESEIFNAISQLIEENNGTETIHREKETTDNRDIISGFSVGNINVKQFTGIDESNINAFSSGLSLFAALRLSSTYTSYFTLNTDGIYTWKPTSESLYYLTFDADSPFIFTDFSLNVKIP